VVWYTLWFLVILKIPVIYLAWVIWWAVKDPPDGPGDASAEEEGPEGGGGLSPRRPSSRPHRGPDRRPARRPARTAPVRTGEVR
jgi:hypothetical protein